VVSVSEAVWLLRLLLLLLLLSLLFFLPLLTLLTAMNTDAPRAAAPPVTTIATH
jgi:hypothetical protein